jgi:hypothetical protein
MTVISTDVLNAFTTAIQGLQRQMAGVEFCFGDLARRMAVVDGRAAPALPGFDNVPHLPAPLAPSLSVTPFAPLASTAAPRGYTAVPFVPWSAPSTFASAPATAAQPYGVPINQICFPHSPSPVPSLDSIMQGSVPVSSAPMATPTSRVHVPLEPEGQVVPKYYKLLFPTFDGKEGPLGWLNKCEQFFSGHQTRHQDRVWLASYHSSPVVPRAGGRCWPATVGRLLCPLSTAIRSAPQHQPYLRPRAPAFHLPG